MISNGTLCAVIIFSLIFLLVGMLYEAQGEHDYFPPHIKWANPPQVCLADIPPEDRYITIRAVNQWEKAFNDYMGDGYFYYNVKFVNSTFINGCNIVVLPVESITNPVTGGNPMGLTTCYESRSYCILRIDRDMANGVYYHDTIVHEMGHALGIGHRLSYEMEGYPAVIMSNDIMMNQAKPFLEITKASLDAIIYFYTEDFYSNYTIPHNDTWKSLE